MEQQPVLIILAGGKGSRLGEIGAVVPKSLFPVFDEPLLFRQIRQSLKADFQKIYISTRKEYIEQFGQGINNFFPNDKDKIAVVENAAHDKGVLYALLNLVQITGVSEALISLGDIYFLENPFLNFKQSSLTGVKVFAMRPQDKRDLSLGGIVFNQRNKTPLSPYITVNWLPKFIQQSQFIAFTFCKFSILRRIVFADES